MLMIGQTNSFKRAKNQLQYAALVSLEELNEEEPCEMDEWRRNSKILDKRSILDTLQKVEKISN